MKTTVLPTLTAAQTYALHCSDAAVRGFDSAYDAYVDGASIDADSLYGVTRDGFSHLTNWTDSSVLFDSDDMDFIHSMF